MADSVPSLDSGKYRVIRELGRGGMGVVHLAEDCQLKRQVALKVLYAHLNKETAFVERFQEEARSVSTLHHPNIVCVHGLNTDGGVLSIDMEYVEGFSLEQRAIGTPVTPHIAVAIARDVLSGLSVCHNIGIVHRDIKPSNILIHEDGTAKLTDFGLATAYASHLEATVCSNTSSGFYMGTPRYMPVAAWEGGTPQPCWDTFAFGVVLYELITGTVAYPGDTPIAIMKNHIAGAPPPIRSVVPGISVALGDLVDQLLHESAASEAMEGGAALRLLQETPEYAELQHSNVVTTVAVPRRRRPRGRLPRRRARIFALSSAIVLGIMGLWFGSPYYQSMGSGTHEVESLPDASTTTSPLSRDQFLDMKTVGPGGKRETWLIEPGARPGTLRISGYSTLGLCRMAGVLRDDGDWDLSGGWAEYVLPRAGSIQYGTLTGSLHWPGGQGDLTVSLNRVQERDGEHEKITLAGSPPSSEIDRAKFLRRFEDGDLLQGLLYTELLPRRLSWAVELEGLLPSPDGVRYFIPFAEGEIRADGNLDEPLWTQSFFRHGIGRIGEVPAIQRGVRSALKMRWSSSATWLAVEVQSSDNDLQWDIALLPAFEVSMKDSARLSLHIDAAGNQTFRYYLGAEEQAAKFSWLAAVNRDTQRSILEVEIPSSVLADHARPAVGKCWRVNVQCYRESAEDRREIVARWGDLNVLKLEHGALIAFEESAP